LKVGNYGTAELFGSFVRKRFIENDYIKEDPTSRFKEFDRVE